MSKHSDVAIIGAGPAGLAAANVLGQAGCSVVVLDEQSGPGGQIYRGVADPVRRSNLGEDRAIAERLCDGLSHSGIKHIPGATVWEVTQRRRIAYSVAGVAQSLTADQLLIASGALERPMPFPGWTLPGVMTVGAGQIMLKTAGIQPAGPCVLAGSGPLLLLLATQYVEAGFTVDAIVETTPAANQLNAFPYLPKALAASKYLLRGLAMLKALRNANVRHYKQGTNLEAIGDKHIEALKFTSEGKRRSLEVGTLLIHTGVCPNVQISRSLNIAHVWDTLQQCWRPDCNLFGRTSLTGIRIAGDGAGIAGADAAVHTGRLAALAMLCDMGVLTSQQRIKRARAELAAARYHARARPFLYALYAPAPAFLDPPDETILCRCEEVTAGEVRAFVDKGCDGPNQAKAFGRPGMGPCQGRYCGLSVSSVIARHRNVPMEQVGYFRIRPPLKPVTLGELAAMPDALDTIEIAKLPQ